MQIQINLILIRATFAFISLVGVTFDIAVVFLELFLLKQLLEHQVHGDRVEGVVGGGNHHIPPVGLEILDQFLVLLDDAQLLNFFGSKRSSLLRDEVPT